MPWLYFGLWLVGLFCVMGQWQVPLFQITCLFQFQDFQKFWVQILRRYCTYLLNPCYCFLFSTKFVKGEVVVDVDLFLGMPAWGHRGLLVIFSSVAWDFGFAILGSHPDLSVSQFFPILHCEEQTHINPQIPHKPLYSWRADLFFGTMPRVVALLSLVL